MGNKKRFTEQELEEHKKEYEKKRRKRDKEKRNEYCKKWYQKNKEKKERKENKMSLNKSIEFLEKLKDKKGIDTEVVNQMQKEVKTLDEALLLDLEKLKKRLYKPIRKVWVLAIKSTNKEEIDQYEEMLNETMNRGKNIFPKSILTISLLRDGSGRFKAINFKKE
jgi:uncharacterized protein (DUF305 family)